MVPTILEPRTPIRVMNQLSAVVHPIQRVPRHGSLTNLTIRNILEMVEISTGLRFNNLLRSDPQRLAIYDHQT